MSSSRRSFLGAAAAAAATPLLQPDTARARSIHVVDDQPGPDAVVVAVGRGGQATVRQWDPAESDVPALSVDDREAFLQAIAPFYTVVVVATLGGRSTEALPEWVEAAVEAEKDVLVVVTTPHPDEGAERGNRALHTLVALRRQATFLDWRPADASLPWSDDDAGSVRTAMRQGLTEGAESALLSWVGAA